MARREPNKRKAIRPAPEFWDRLALVIALAVPALPHWVLLALAVVLLSLPARLFRRGR